MGSGAFGSIYKGENIRTKELVAIKIEPLDANLKLLKNESTIYNYLKKFNFNGIPHLKWYGLDTTNYYMVISLLGDSINSYIEKNGKMDLAVVLTIGLKILDIIKFILISQTKIDIKTLSPCLRDLKMLCLKFTLLAICFKPKYNFHLLRLTHDFLAGPENNFYYSTG